MSEFLGYLQRLKVRPDEDDLTQGEIRYLKGHFDPNAAEVTVDGVPINWTHIDEVEVVKAARERGPMGWMVKQMMGEDRYHVGIYYGAHEAVLINVPLKTAEHVVRTIAFYAPQPIRYSGIEGLSPLASPD
jgi:hypothetical protein